MKKYFSLPALFVSAIVLASVTKAQVSDPSLRGPLSVVASISTHRDGTSTQSDHVLVKPPKDQTVAPTPWTTLVGPSGQSFSMTALFGVHADYVDIDAMSSGNAFIPELLSGEPDLTGSWAALTLSVDNAANGASGNGWIDLRKMGEFSSRLTPGADLATHYLHTTATGVLNQNLIGNTFITQLAEHQGLGQNQDIDSLDIGMGVLAQDPAFASRLFFKNTETFYFSITPASAVALNDTSNQLPTFAYETPGGGAMPADAAVVYCCTWTQTSAPGTVPAVGYWEAPYLFLNRAQLDLDLVDTPSNIENIDAIDISTADGEVRAVFSTQRKTGRSQIRHLELQTNGTGEVSDLESDGVLVTSHFGIVEKTRTDAGDDVDAICFFDPEPSKYDNLIGIAVPSRGIAGIGLSTTFVEETPDDGEFTFQITGELTPPGSGSTPTFFSHLTVEYALEGDYDPQSPNAPSNWLPLVSGWSTGTTTHLYSTFAPPSSIEDQDLFFRVKARATPGASVFAKSWVCAMSVLGS